MSDNKNLNERHGCIVCGKIYDLLVVYHPDGHMVDCKVTSAGGHRVPDAHRPLVACDTHPAAKIEAAYAKLFSDHKSEDDE